MTAGPPDRPDLPRVDDVVRGQARFDPRRPPPPPGAATREAAPVDEVRRPAPVEPVAARTSGRRPHRWLRWLGRLGGGGVAVAIGGVVLFASEVFETTAAEQIVIPAGIQRIELRGNHGDVDVVSGSAGPAQVSTRGRFSACVPPSSVEDGARVLVIDATCAGDFSGSAAVVLPQGYAVTVTTSSGDVKAAGAFERVDVTSSSGDVSLGGVKGHVKVGTKSGSVDVAGDVPYLSASTDSGDVSFQATGAVVQGVDVRTSSGDVELGLPHTSPYKVDVDTHGNREQSRDLAVSPTASEYVRVDSHSGDVTLR